LAFTGDPIGLENAPIASGGNLGIYPLVVRVSWDLALVDTIRAVRLRNLLDDGLKHVGWNSEGHVGDTVSSGKRVCPCSRSLGSRLTEVGGLYSMIKSLRGKDTDSSPPGYRTLRSRILTGVGELIDAPMSASNHALSIKPRAICDACHRVGYLDVLSSTLN
jgi:hypothetical protein